MKKIFKRILKRTIESNIGVYAADSAFFVILSSFPFILTLISLIRYIPPARDLLENLSVDFLSGEISAFINGLLREIYAESSTFVIGVGITASLISSSRGIQAIIGGMNTVYKTGKYINFISLKISSLIYTLAASITIIITLLLIVFSKRLVFFIDGFFPGFAYNIQVFLKMRWLLASLILFLFFMLIYSIIPEKNKKKKLIPRHAPGALFSSLGWIIFSAFYSLYLNKFSGNLFYGSITAVILLMLWLYFCMYILFIGGVINAILSESEKERNDNNISPTDELNVIPPFVKNIKRFFIK